MSGVVLERPGSYGYDASLDYLTSANYGDGNPNQAPSWSYDAAGNRNDAAVDNLSRATSVGGVACTNDVLGNRLTGPAGQYSWDCLNRMTRIVPIVFGTVGKGGGTNGLDDDDPTPAYEVGSQYRYRADGMRVQKVVNGALTRYRHDGQMPVEDLEVATSGAQALTRYGLGARGVDLIERTGSSGTVTAFPVYDAHGNNVASLTRNGSGGCDLSDRRTYDAWGVVRSQQSGGDPKLRYCASLGHRQDDESGLVYMRARYYEPGSGRFISEDPGRSGRNWFAYCDNDPIDKVDNSGKNPLLIAMAMGFLLAASADLVFQAMTKMGTGQSVDWLEVGCVGLGGACMGGFAAVAAALLGGGGALGAAGTAIASNLSAVQIGSALAGGAGLGSLSGAVAGVFYELGRDIQIKGLLREMDENEFTNDPFGLDIMR